jgi:hypothetical protein
MYIWANKLATPTFEKLDQILITIVTPHVMKTLIKFIRKRLGANTILNLKVEFKNSV